MKAIRYRAWPGVAVAVTATVSGGVGRAADEPVAGRYRVEVSLEMPNVRGTYPLRTVERCLGPGAPGPASW